MNRVSTTVRHIRVGDQLTNGQTVQALGPVERDRDCLKRYVRRVQFAGQAFSRCWNAATSMTVLREGL